MSVNQFVLEMGRPSFRDMQLTAQSPDDLADSEALLAISRFSLTANNVTYALFGDAMKYWNFFPASSASLGRVPVWGYAEVIASKTGGVDVGSRVYGYFPIANTLKVQPVKVSAASFRDGAAHRQEMAAAYNHYNVVQPEDGETEGLVHLPELRRGARALAGPV